LVVGEPIVTDNAPSNFQEAAYLLLCRDGLDANRAVGLALKLNRMHEQRTAENAFKTLELAGKHPRLSPQENEFLRHLATGRSQKSASAEMRVSPHTTDTYRRRILKKTGAKTIAEAMLQAMLHSGGLTDSAVGNP